LLFIFLDVLEEYRENFLRKVGYIIFQNIQRVLHGKGPSLKYRFENVDTISLLLEPMNLWYLVSLCDMK
jgi:hypothetical protein